MLVELATSSDYDIMAHGIISQREPMYGGGRKTRSYKPAKAIYEGQ